MFLYITFIVSLSLYYIYIYLSFLKNSLFLIQDIHKELERKISLFHQREDAILYISCFDANAGIFETLLSADDAIVSDELNHASIIDGIRLSKAKRYRYKHRDMGGVSHFFAYLIYIDLLYFFGFANKFLLFFCVNFLCKKDW